MACPKLKMGLGAQKGAHGFIRGDPVLEITKC